MRTGWWPTLAAVAGGTVFAAAGAVMGSMNAGWFGLERNANALFPLLGAGVAVALAGWAAAGWGRRVWDVGVFGKAAVVLLVVSPAVYLLSWLIAFAIFGTLAFGLGLVLLAVTLRRQRLMPRADRMVVIVSALGSLTWNTETLSAFLLVGVGLLWVLLAVRVLAPPARTAIVPPP